MRAAVEVDADALAVVEVIAIVQNDARRQGLTEVLECRQIAKAERAVEVLRGQGTPVQVLVAALRLEARATRWGRLCGPEDWKGLIRGFEEAFRSPAKRDFYRERGRAVDGDRDNRELRPLQRSDRA